MTILFDGIAYGMLLFVLAVGLAVTLGLMNFVNLAHGAFAMAGGYVSVLLMHRPACRSSPACRSPLSPPRCSARCSSARSTSDSTAAAHLDQVLFSIGLVFMAVAAVDVFPRARCSRSSGCRRVCRAACRSRRSHRRLPPVHRSRSARCSPWRCSRLLARTRFGSQLRAAVDDATRGRAASASTSTASSPSPSRSARASPGSAARSGRRCSASTRRSRCAYMVYFLLVVAVGGTDHHHRPAARGAHPRHRRRARQVLRARGSAPSSSTA